MLLFYFLLQNTTVELVVLVLVLFFHELLSLLLLCVVSHYTLVSFYFFIFLLLFFISISLEETHEALRTFDILGIQEKLNINAATCKSVSEVLSSSAVLKDLFYALRVNDVLKCDIKEETFEVFFYLRCSISKTWACVRSFLLTNLQINS